MGKDGLYGYRRGMLQPVLPPLLTRHAAEPGLPDGRLWSELRIALRWPAR